LRERTIGTDRQTDKQRTGRKSNEEERGLEGGWLQISEREREREREREEREKREFLDSTLPSLLGFCWKVLPQIERDREILDSTLSC
jgi:hypothetical protein